jgi:hypothetical protein
MIHKSTTFTTIFRVKKCYFHYDFACKKVPLSLRYAKIVCSLFDECQKRPNLHTNKLNTTFFCSTSPLKAPNLLKPLKLA